MLKRGQVTILVIVGVVILFAFIFVYMLRSGYIEKVVQTGDVSKRLELEFDSIKNEQIGSCISKETNSAMKLIGDNGGYLTSIDKAGFYGQQFTVLCKPILNEPAKCARSALDVNFLEQRLQEHLKEQLFKCIDLSAYREKDYILQDGEIKTDVKINLKNVIITVDYPVSISKGAIAFNTSVFKIDVNVPLREMLFVVNDVLNTESNGQFFHIASYSLSHPRYEVKEYSLAPRKFYVIRNYDSNYAFRFAVENYQQKEGMPAK